MKRLIWKELMESRYIPLAYASLMTVLLIVWAVMGNYVATHGGSPVDGMSMGEAAGLLAFGVFFSGLLPGCNAIAGEVGNNTLPFLASLPVSRSRIWWSKVLGGAIVMVSGIIAMTAAFCLVTVCVFGRAAIVEMEDVVRPVMSVGVQLNQGFVADFLTCLYFLFVGIVMLSFVLGFSFSLALFASSLVDRPLAAFGVALVLAAALAGCYLSANGEYSYWLGPNFHFLLFGYEVAGLFLAGFAVFRYGGALHNRGKYAIGAFAVFMLFLPLVGSIVVERYEQSLVALESPVIVTRTYLPIVAPFKLKTWITYQKYVISYPLVEAGGTYRGVLSFGFSENLRMVPAPAMGMTPAVTSQVRVSPQQTTITRTRILYDTYDIDYTYTPRLPAGPDTQQIEVLSKDGTVIGRITIQAKKTSGFMPHDPRGEVGYDVL